MMGHSCKAEEKGSQGEKGRGAIPPRFPSPFLFCWLSPLLPFSLSPLLCFLLADAAAQPTGSYVGSNLRPPAVAREFRGVWIASVKNIDWPSRPGLPVGEQKAELRALLSHAKRLRLNAVLLQIRPSCDALYDSRIEPWSEYLSGRMGQPPVPYYDPLAFAIEEAHQRGLELHAWFNPYRARHPAAISPAANNHISRTRPQLVRTFGKSLWLDPGERDVQEHSLAVVMDVVRRYDIDGVHFDDYFYPYPEKDQPPAFPDSASWKRYAENGGKLGREDWRRENVNLFIVRVSQSIKALKPWVKFGIAPFGIWRPGHPAQVKGLDAYAAIYADSRKWLREGWVDYLAPQLYWGEEKKETSFGALLQWWVGENTHHRHLWPGLDISRVGPNRPPEEIVNQVRLTRQQSGSDGNIYWGVRALTENRRGLTEVLAKQTYAQPALPPSLPWIDNQPPSRPQISATITSAGEVRVTCKPVGGEPVEWWLVQTRIGTIWSTEVVPGFQSAGSIVLSNKPEVIAVSAVDRCGNVSAPAVLESRRQESGVSNQ
jgi:uncharacterized lipoprotein YddW (UPF0748 family)